MKYMIASDIHGSAYYCKLLLEQFEKEKADILILLGDILYHGPRNDLPKDYNPKEVVEMLNSIKEDIIAIQGNCDADVDQMVLYFPLVPSFALISYGKRNIYLTHGHINNPEDPLPLRKGDVQISGHTHVPLCAEKDDVVFLNPGSTSIPKENTKHSYMTLEDNFFHWKDLTTGQSYGTCILKD